MLLFGRLVPPDNVGYQHPVLFQNAHGVACLASDVPVLAHLPGPEHFLHHMTGHTELRIFPGVFVIAEAHDPAGYRYKQEKDDDSLLVLFYEPYKERSPG